MRVCDVEFYTAEQGHELGEAGASNVLGGAVEAERVGEKGVEGAEGGGEEEGEEGSEGAVVKGEERDGGEEGRE